MLIYKIIVNLLNNTKYTIYINILIYIYGRKSILYIETNIEVGMQNYLLIDVYLLWKIYFTKWFKIYTIFKYI